MGSSSSLPSERTCWRYAIGDGVMTWGIPVGFGVIVFTIVITAIYVQRANSEFDELSEKVKREALK